MIDADSTTEPGLLAACERLLPQGVGMSTVLARPGDDAVHLWRAPLDVDRHGLSVLESFLSPDESDCAKRFRRDCDGARYTAARGWLRWLIARYLDADPCSLTFNKGAFGKPELTQPAASWLHFNLAHSADLAVFAIASRRQIGVDVERIRADFPVDAVAKRLLSSKERLALVALSPDRRSRAFFDLWVRTEAYVKAIGVGVAAVENRELHGDHRAGWLVAAFGAGDGYAAAVAVEGGGVRVPAAAQTLRVSGL